MFWSFFISFWISLHFFGIFTIFDEFWVDFFIQFFFLVPMWLILSYFLLFFNQKHKKHFCSLYAINGIHPVVFFSLFLRFFDLVQYFFFNFFLNKKPNVISYGFILFILFFINFTIFISLGNIYDLDYFCKNPQDLKPQVYSLLLDLPSSSTKKPFPKAPIESGSSRSEFLMFLDRLLEEGMLAEDDYYFLKCMFFEQGTYVVNFTRSAMRYYHPNPPPFL